MKIDKHSLLLIEIYLCPGLGTSYPIRIETYVFESDFRHRQTRKTPLFNCHFQ